MKIDHFVLLLFNGIKYPGKNISISEEEPKVDCMEKKTRKKDGIFRDWDYYEN